VTLPELDASGTRSTAQPPPVPAAVDPARVTQAGVAVPELVEEPHDTGVMDAIDPALLAAAGEVGASSGDDVPKTTSMDAVDLAALGLDPSAPTKTAQMGVVLPPDDDEPGDAGNSNGDRADGKSRKRRKRR
jgi:hypothetical protein